MHTLIITPLAIELKHLVNALNQIGMGLEESDGQYRNSNKGIICASAGHGKVEFALGCQEFLIKYPSLKRVIGVGGAGALEESVKPFDVVVGTQIIEHDYKEKFDTQAVLPTFTTTEDLVNRFREVMASNFKIHFGPIAAGDEDIMDLTRANEIRRETKALAVNWESAGLARACRRHKIDFVELRGITDACNGAVAESFKLNLPQAIENTALMMNEALLEN